MSDPDMPTDDKYLVYKRQEFLEWLGHASTLDLSMEEVPSLLGQLERLSLRDAVVIRRQDLFASPCLDVYARTIAIVASREQDPKTKAELLDIADYFQRQAELAAEEGFKLPDL